MHSVSLEEFRMPDFLKTLSIRLLACSLVLPAIAFGQPTLDGPARDVDRAESVRAVKKLQRTYAQYSQYARPIRCAARISRCAA